MPIPKGEKILSRSGREIDIENRADNTNWDNSLSSWGYWWRHICWWNDGKSIGIYLLKHESESWLPEYNSTIDEYWFEGTQFKTKEMAENDN